MTKIAMFTGSFDPITNGHMDIIVRASKLFDELYIGLFYNKKSGAYQTKIKLKESDKYLLDEIHQIFPFFIKPRLETREDGNYSYYIYKYSKKLFKDLEKVGIYQRKSYENAEN